MARSSACVPWQHRGRGGHRVSASSDYQKLRAHWRFCVCRRRRSTARSPRPRGEDQAQPFRLLERLPVEVDAVESAARPAWPASVAALAFTLADFDFSAQPTVDPKLIAELATLRFVEDATNILFMAARRGQDHAGRGLARPWWARGSASFTPPPPSCGPLPPRRPRRPVGHHHALLRRHRVLSSTRPLPAPPRRGRVRPVPSCQPEIRRGTSC